MTDGDTTPERTHHTEASQEETGRGVEIDAGFYLVSVDGDPSDSLATVLETAFEAADRAKADATELDDRIDDDGRQYR